MYMRAAYSWHAKGSVSFNLFDLSVSSAAGFITNIQYSERTVFSTFYIPMSSLEMFLIFVLSRDDTSQSMCVLMRSSVLPLVAALMLGFLRLSIWLFGACNFRLLRIGQSFRFHWPRFRSPMLSCHARGSCLIPAGLF